MRRLHLVLGIVLVLAVSCAAGPAPTTPTVPASATSEPTRTSVGPTSTAAPEWPGVELMVTNDDGVFSIDSTGEITQLVTGRVVYAMDDTRGGLLFQVERGRAGPSQTDSAIWWVPRGMGEAQQLIVPTPNAGHELTLFDAFVDGEGDLQVVYVRSDTPVGYWDWVACAYDGVCPSEPTWYSGIHEDLIDRLRLFNLDERKVTELAAVGAFESGISSISAGGGEVVVLLHHQVGQDCALLNPSTAIEPTEGIQQGVWAELVWVPWVEVGCEGDECPDVCTPSPSGGLFAYTLAGQTSVIDTESGSERLLVDGRLVDMSDTHLLVDDGISVLVVSVDDPTRKVRVPVEGGVRLAAAPVAIHGPVVPPTPATIQLRADGLGVVDFGDPVDEVIGVLTGLLGAPDSTAPIEGRDCYRSVREARSVTWEAWGLRLVFTDWGGSELLPVPAPVHLSDWEVFAPGLSTPLGVGVGSNVRELRAAYPQVLVGINEFAPWFMMEAEGIQGGFDWPFDSFRQALDEALADRLDATDIAGEWNTDEALFAFLEQSGMTDPTDVLTALGLPPWDVAVGWMHGGSGPLCD